MEAAINSGINHFNQPSKITIEMKKKPDPKYKSGQCIFNTTTNENLTIEGEPEWNGLCWMYSFKGTVMSCGEMYLRPLTALYSINNYPKLKAENETLKEINKALQQSNDELLKALRDLFEDTTGHYEASDEGTANKIFQKAKKAIKKCAPTLTDKYNKEVWKEKQD